MNEISCLVCLFCKNNYCTKYKTTIQEYFQPKECKFFTIKKKPLNKGLQIRQNKLKKQQKKRNTISSEQESLCRFIEVKWEDIKKINGKYTHTGQAHGKGLQIKNRVYLTDGHYKMVNNKGFKIITKHKGTPDWATAELIEKYNKFYTK